MIIKTLKAIKFLVIFLGEVFFLILVAGCGQTGSLYLPKQYPVYPVVQAARSHSGSQSRFSKMSQTKSSVETPTISSKKLSEVTE